MLIRRIFIALAACLGAGQSIAAEYDGSKPLICATVDTRRCVVGEPCMRGEAEAVNFPRFIRVNIAAKTATSIGGNRTTPIDSVRHDGGSLVLQGTDAGRGWTATISETTGDMTIAGADAETAYVLFGACMVDD